MPLEGLRAWIGEVERKLRARTLALLALVALAIGAAGAAVYLAADAHDIAVSEGDVQALQERLETRIDEARGGGSEDALAQLESELKTLREQVDELKAKGEASGAGGGSAGGGAGSGGGSGKGEDSGSGAGKEDEGGGASSGATGKLRELLEQAAEQQAK